MTLQVFIGWDSREVPAYEVCRATLLRHASVPLVVAPLKHKALRQAGLFDRPWAIDGKTGAFRDERDGKPFSTEFAHSRFLVPFLASAAIGPWALFVDADFLFAADVAELLALADGTKAVQVVQHHQVPRARETKMDDAPQEAYRRKNWSSLILWNLAHPAHDALSVHDVNHRPGQWLHGFGWLADEAIGALPEAWNWLEGHSDPAIFPKAIHFTRGGPWFEGWGEVAYAERWRAEWRALVAPANRPASPVNLAALRGA